MANKGETKALKIYNVGLVHKVDKSKTFVIKSKTGKHTFNKAVSIGYIIRDLLHLADNYREVVFILKNKNILVDKKIITSPNAVIGLYDIIEIPKLKKQYSVIFKKNGLISLIEIDEKDTNYKICKIISKKIIKNNKIQLITNDGRVILTDNKAYKIKSSIKLDIVDNTIKEYYPLEKGRQVFIIGGKHIGYKATIENIIKSENSKKILLELKSNEDTFQTTDKNIIIIN